jgi:hypothetical protein
MEMDDASHWPFALLQNVAAYPHVTGVAVKPWETLAFADPAEPLGAGTELAACLVVPPRLLSDEAVRFAAGDGVSVSLLALVPIYAAELDLARREGAQALAELLDEAGVTELLDPARPPVVGDSSAILDGFELPDKVTDQLAALPGLLEHEERPELLARAQLGMFDRGLLVLTDRRLLFLSGVSREETSALIALPRSELQTLWAHGEHVVVRAGDVREVLGDIQPRARVADLAAVGPSPASADAHVEKLEALATNALGRMAGALFRGRITELAVDLDADEQVSHLSDGKLDRVNGLVVLTDRRLFFLGEAIRRAKRREEMIPIERIRGHNARLGVRPSLAVTVDDGREIELRMGRADVRRLSDALPH